tara:strand:+ start:506 stop:934 length:429 start_codon:yes stop_codon:yes gene_type:complete
MSKIKLDTDVLKHIALFESMTGAKVKDCFPEEKMITYVVEEHQAAKAIGKQGANVKKLHHMAKKNIKIIEFSQDIHKFIQNVVHPNKVSNVEEKEEDGKKIILLTAIDHQTRGYLIGRAAETLRNTESMVKRYFEVDEIKVV